MTETRSGIAFGAMRWRPGTAPRRRGRASGRHRLARSGTVLHLVGAIAMLFGLLLPLTPAGRALAAPASQQPASSTIAQGSVPTTGFTQVSAIGNFQGQLGCGDFDPYCGGSALTNHNGIWTGTFPIAPGDYQWQIAALTQDGQQYIFGQGGANGGTRDVDVDDDQAGVFFTFNAATQESDAEAVDAIYALATDVGAYALGPDGNGLSAIVFSQGGGLNLELQVNGAPVGNPQFANLDPGPNLITVDTDGNVVDVDGLGYGSLTINRLDANDQPLAGGCYELRRGNDVVSRGCDTDDGFADGNTTISFPEGLDPGGYTIVEVSAPQGQEPAEDQDVDLQQGDNVAQVRSAGGGIEGPDEDTPEAGDTPDDQQQGPPGDLVVTLQGEDGQPIGEACFQLKQGDTVVAEECDSAFSPGDTFPGNGNTGFFGVPSGTYTLHQSSAPDGTEPVQDQEVQVPAGQQQNITVTTSADEAPTEEPSPTPTETPADAGTGDVVVLRQDADGNPIGGACFEIRDPAGNVVVNQVCDEDGDVPNDGRTGFFSIPVGSYVLHETRTPDGYEPAQDTPFDVIAGQPVDVPVQSNAVATETPTGEPSPTATETETETPQGEPGNLIVTLVGQNQQPIGGACFQLKQGDQVIAEQCDDASNPGDTFPGNGNTGFFGVPSGPYTLRQSGVPDGTQAAPDQEVQVPAGGEDTVTVTAAAGDEAPTPANEARTPTPTEDVTVPGDAGVVLVDLGSIDQSQGPVCVELNTTGGIGLINAPSACDNSDGDGDGTPGVIRIDNVPPGDYALFVTQGPDDATNLEPQSVSVIAGQVVNVSLQPAAPTPEPTATTEPTPEPSPTPEPGALEVTVVDPDGQLITSGGACVAVDGSGQFCDGGDEDQSGEPGVIEVANLPAGEHEVALSQAPTGFEPTDETETADVQPGDIAFATIALQPSGPTSGTLTIHVRDSGNEPVGNACFTLVNTDGTADICDDDGDGDISAENISFLETTVTQTSAEDGYAVDPTPQTVTLSREQPTAELTFTNALQPGTLPVVATNANDEPIGGACWTLSGDGGSFGPLCDDGANGGTELDGQVQFEQVLPGTYTLSETQAPTGFLQVDGREVTVNPGENQAVRVAHEVAPATVQITTTDGQGALPGACYAIDDGEAVCDEENGDGIVLIENVAPGDHTVRQTQAPAGYRPAADQPITVGAGESVQVAFQNAPLTGSIAVVVVDPDGNPVAGGCVTLDGGNQICDDQAGDANTTDPSVIRIDGVGLGEHQVTLESVSAGFELPDEPQSVTVEADAVATVRFELARVQPQTGGVDVTVRVEGREVVPGACVVLTSTANNEVLGPFCDGDDADSNPEDGVIGIDDVPVGIYVVSLAEGVQSEGGDVAAADTPSVEIVAGERAEVTVTLPPLPITGTARILTLAGQTPVGGACYELYATDAMTPVCDNDDRDNDGTAGVIELGLLRPGTYELRMSQAPEGYEPAATTDITIAAGETTTVEIQVTPSPQPGTLTVAKVDGDGNALGGACFALQQNGGNVAALCDEDGDGTIIFEDLAAGDYTLVETKVPSNRYEKAASRTVTINAGANTDVTVTNVERPGRLLVTTVDRDDTSLRLNNACYRLEGEATYGPFCDADDGAVNGRVVFNGVAAGDYTLVETVAPAGYQAAQNRDVTITAGTMLQITVENAKTPPPAEVGTLVVLKKDGAGNDLPGGCFQLLDGNNPITDPICDIDDGVNDARLRFEQAPAGTWTLRETLAPSASYVLADDREITIEQDQTTEVEVRNVLKQGRVLVRAVNDRDQPLQNACFDLASENQEPRCSDAAGETLFSNLAPGAYTLSQTQAPYGYERSDATRNVQVQPGQTTVVKVVFKAAPPPNTGSVQIQKFYCPAGEQGERTQFLGGAQGNAQLAKTAGCRQDNAAFTLVAEDGSGDGPGAVQTGTDGRYQVTLPEGIYVLTETDPDLPGASSARLRVVTGQLTTVVVINYIAPPKPQPATINVVSYTCPPSFNGTLYDDFAESCRADRNLTNNLTVRAEGPVKARRVTGDQGQLGRTSFKDLPAGKYTISGEKPYTIPLMYQFCGTDGNWPADQKAINGSLTFTLQYGQTLSCHFFQVPEQLTQDTGGVLVQKFDCPVETAPKGYDYKSECARSDAQNQFELNQWNLEMQRFEDFTTGQANPDGILRFTKLRPGTYELKEIGSTWCFAQSNSVDAKGNLIVKPNALVEVYIYNCVGTKEPPNTGSGDAAALLNPTGGGTDGTLVLMNLAWPALGLAAWLIWRSRRPSAQLVTVRSDGHRRRAA